MDSSSFRARQRSRARALALPLTLTVTACGSTPEPEASVAHGDDLSLSTDQGFDPGDLASDAEFTDANAMSLAAIEAFLARTPYSNRSFLASFASNGVPAARAIAEAARTYRIHPAVFLVFAQLHEGLVAESVYPYPAKRVVHAFGCGCTNGVCSKAFEGFDAQVDCLGARLRRNLDAVSDAARGATEHGFAIGREHVSTDGVRVVPKNAASAALYEATGRVGVKEARGTWVFWNLWTKWSLGVASYDVSYDVSSRAP